MPGRPAAGISTADLGRAHRKPRRPVSAARDLLTLLFWLSSATCWRNPRKFSRRLRYDVSCGARLPRAAGFREFCKRARGGRGWLRGVGGCSVIYELLGRLSGWWMELRINVYVFFFFLLSFFFFFLFFEILGVAVNWILFTLNYFLIVLKLQRAYDETWIFETGDWSIDKRRWYTPWHEG